MGSKIRVVIMVFWFLGICGMIGDFGVLSIVDRLLCNLYNNNKKRVLVSRRLNLVIKMESYNFLFKF